MNRVVLILINIIVFILCIGCTHKIKLTELSDVVIKKNLFGEISLEGPGGFKLASRNISIAWDDAYCIGRYSPQGERAMYFLFNGATGDVELFEAPEELNMKIQLLGYKSLYIQNLTDFESLILKMGGRHRGRLQKSD